MRPWCLLLAFLPLGATAQDKPADVSVRVGGPEEAKLGAYVGHEGHPIRKYSVLIHTGATKMTLQHWVDVHPSHAPKVLPLEGLIGFPRPAQANWYSNGFLNIFYGNEPVGDVPVKSVRATEQGERGAAQFEWHRAEGTWIVTFLAFPKGKSLFCAVRYFPSDRPVKWRLKLDCYPGRQIPGGERYVTTAARVLEEGQHLELDRAREWWLLLADRVFAGDTPGSDGPAGLIYAPEDVGAVRVSVNDYPIFTELEPAEGRNEIRMIFWDSFFGRTNAEALEFMRQTAEEQLERLRKTSFVNREVFSGKFRERQAEIEKLLQVVSADEALRRRVRKLGERLAGLAERLTKQGRKIGPADETAFLEERDEQEKLWWQLRWEALFTRK